MAWQHPAAVYNMQVYQLFSDKANKVRHGHNLFTLRSERMAVQSPT